MSRRRLTQVWMALLALSGCDKSPTIPAPQTDPAQLYYSLTLNDHAVTLSTVAPYDTITLTASPRSAVGVPLATVGTPTFTSLDLDHVQVDSVTGRVHAIATGRAIGVVAALAIGGVTHADTVMINVTDTATPPTLTTFSVQPRPGDSTKVSVDGGGAITPRALDGSGNPIPGIAVYYTSSDPTIAYIDRSAGYFVPVRPGKVRFTATTTVYGVTKRDSVQWTIGHILYGVVTITPEVNAQGKIVATYVPDSIVMEVGGRVTFQNLAGPPTDVTFDNPADAAQDNAMCSALPLWCGTGNVPAFALLPNDSTGNSALRFRTFPVQGTIRYHSTISGATGVLVVTAD
ncbi:MAG TPA: hypothetical protein VNW46_15405 [Gemmatimonadaceae bacterium]|nr:hypothetical protein [Gemmatimonadaceae bacterium]